MAILKGIKNRPPFLLDSIAKLGKGDSVSVIGSLKPSEWIDKSGEVKHGLNITVNNALSPYDIKKRRPETAGGV